MPALPKCKNVRISFGIGQKAGQSAPEKAIFTDFGIIIGIL
jgi:hypothetical protein